MGAARGAIDCSICGKNGDTTLLRRARTFTSPPDAVAVVNGRLAASFNWGEVDKTFLQVNGKRGFVNKELNRW
jgi:hypothetical protein